jgi:hypothetical protein
MGEHTLYPCLVCHTYKCRARQPQLRILVPIAQPVALVGLKAFNLAGAGYLKALFGAAMGLHFWHSRVFLIKRTAKVMYTG